MATTSSEPNEAEQDPHHQLDEASTNLDQIRDILFGSQSRTIEARLDDLRGELADAVDNMRSLIKSRTDSLATKIESDVRELRTKLKETDQLSDQRNTDLSKRLQQTSNEFQQHLGALSETLSATERSLRADADRQLNDLREQLIGQMDTMKDQLQREISQVSGATVTKRTLSDALREISARLDDE